MTKQLHQWWELTFTGDDVEERAIELNDLGSAGGHLLSTTSIKVYLYEGHHALDDFLSQAEELGFHLSEKRIVPEENWSSLCPELWEPLTLGSITVKPVAEIDDQQPLSEPEQDELFIIPGTGFGTGHHATTATLFTWMQETQLFDSQPLHVLDLGTGSGILAILAARLFPAQVVAVDIDELALDNARDNIRLNRLESRISTINGTVADINTTFQLISANIYAEVLVEIERSLSSLLDENGLLFLSGIHQDKLLAVESSYHKTDWEWIRCEINDSWVSVILKSLRSS